MELKNHMDRLTEGMVGMMGGMNGIVKMLSRNLEERINELSKTDPAKAQELKKQLMEAGLNEKMTALQKEMNELMSVSGK
jgi:hypothetical protein